MKTKTHFAFRVDIWDDTGDSIVEHVAGVEDYQVALATFRAACERWPRHADHLAAGRASDRGQPTPASGVGEFGCPKFALSHPKNANCPNYSTVFWNFGAKPCAKKKKCA
jgi:hypothetical protein